MFLLLLGLSPEREKKGKGRLVDTLVWYSSYVLLESFLHQYNMETNLQY